MKPIALLSLAPLLLSPAFAQVDAATAIRAGLDAEALAAAGVAAGSVDDVLSDVTASDAYITGDLATADAAYRSARSTVDGLRRKVKSGQATEQEVTDLATAKTDLAQAESDVQTALDALFTAGTSGLSNAQKLALSTIRSNRHHAVPVELCCVDRTDQQWIALKKALDHEKVAQKYDTAVHSDVATLLANARGDTDVSNAKSNLDANLAAIKSAWDQNSD